MLKWLKKLFVCSHKSFKVFSDTSKRDYKTGVWSGQAVIQCSCCGKMGTFWMDKPIKWRD